jgi:hypothetical protein
VPNRSAAAVDRSLEGRERALEARERSLEARERSLERRDPVDARDRPAETRDRAAEALERAGEPASTDPAQRTARWLVDTYGRLEAENRAAVVAEFYTGEQAAFWRRVLANVRRSPDR